MSDDAPPPPLSPELASKLWQAMCRAMDKDSRDRLLIAGVDLDDAGPYAVAEMGASKLKPKKYGEQVDMNYGVQPDDPLAALIRSVQGSSFKPVQQGVSSGDEREDDR